VAVADDIYDRLHVSTPLKDLPRSVKRWEDKRMAKVLFKDGSRLMAWPKEQALAVASDDTNIVRVKWLKR
jgi:hypothetical protein